MELLSVGWMMVMASCGHGNEASNCVLLADRSSAPSPRPSDKQLLLLRRAHGHLTARPARPPHHNVVRSA